MRLDLLRDDDETVDEDDAVEESLEPDERDRDLCAFGLNRDWRLDEFRGMFLPYGSVDAPGGGGLQTYSISGLLMVN